MQQGAAVATYDTGRNDSMLANERTNALRIDLLLLAVILVTALGIRLYGITHHAPQPDERLWVSRSAKVLHRLKTTPLEATTHLPHPGIPAAFTMATGQWINQKISTWKGKPAHTLSLREASRIAMALLALLLIPIVFWGTRSLLGSTPALLAAGLVAFDPKHIGYSRIAHIDTTLTLIITATVLLYLAAVREGSLRLKIMAGVGWGLCICTKPTSVALIGIFFLWRCLRFLVRDKLPAKGERHLIGWGEVWAIILGHITLSCLYTRLWVHKSEYLDRMHIRTKVAGWLWRTGKALRPYSFELITLGVIFIAAGLFLLYRWKRNSRPLHLHTGMSLFTVGFITTTYVALPQVYENLARYWKWVFGLKTVRHESFSKVIVEPTGYLNFLIFEMPVLATTGALLGVIFLILFWLKNSSSEELEKKLFLTGILLVPIVWLGLLSASSKQAWRYALPSVGFIYILAGFGFWSLFSRIILGERRRTLLSAGALLLIFWQGFSASLWFPNYHLYFNSISGGLPGALKRGHPFTFTGQIDAVRFLMQARERRGVDSLFISVFGDSEGMEDTSRHLFPAEPDSALLFKYFRRSTADYVVTFDSHPTLVPRTGWEDVLSTTPVYEAFFKGARVLAIYQVPPSSFTTPLQIPFDTGHHATGRINRIPGYQGNFLVASPKNHQAGYLFFTTGFPAKAGEYTLLVEAVSHEPGETIPDTKPIAELQFNGCKRPVTAGAIRNSLSTITLNCTIEKDGRLLPKIFWRGNAPFGVKSVTIERVIQ